MKIKQSDRDMVENCFKDMVRSEIKRHVARIKDACVTNDELEQAFEIYKDVIREEWGYPALQILREEVESNDQPNLPQL